jgi:glycosyltransferase involved in cell wall biosynthesis
MTAPACTVVVATHNAAAALQALLAGLAEQTKVADSFEVVVVLDGCTDGSIDVVHHWQRSSHLSLLRCLEQPRRGIPTARNAGLAEARSPVILFLGDDLVPHPQLVSTHLRWHQDGEAIAVLGDYQVVHGPVDGLYLGTMWVWSMDYFARRAVPGRLSCYTDFCAANASLRREDLLRVGGFDATFPEDITVERELGYRLLTAGVRFIVDRTATARCHHNGGLNQALRARYNEGAADVELGRRYPELLRGLRLASGPGHRLRHLVAMTQHAPRPPDPMTASLLPLLQLYQRLKLRRRWLGLWQRLCRYAYWRGVFAALGSWKAVDDYQSGAPPAPRVELDISKGLSESVQHIWAHGPNTLLLRVFDRTLGTIELAGPLEDSVLPHLAETITEQCRTQLLLLLLTDSNMRQTRLSRQYRSSVPHQP